MPARLEAHASCRASDAMTRACIAGMLVLAAGCASSDSNPVAPQGSRLLEGQTLSAVDGGAIGALSVRVGIHTVRTDGSGNFQVDVGGPGSFDIVVTGTGAVERHTTVTGPSAERAKITIIPASFNLDAFDEMFRASGGRLRRWTTRPSLVVVASVLKYTDGDNDQYAATAEQLSDDEIAAMVANLSEGLALLTGNTYNEFAGVTIERPRSGEMVTVRRTGQIVVGRYTGITTLAHTIGYGSCAEQPDGTVTAGSMWLDRDFDKADARRRLLRIHELGHALGYLHVTVSTSVMNPAIGPDPTDFDRAGAIVAFQRPVGNVAPDTDPTTGPRTFSVSEGGARWSAPIR